MRKKAQAGLLSSSMGQTSQGTVMQTGGQVSVVQAQLQQQLLNQKQAAQAQSPLQASNQTIKQHQQQLALQAKRTAEQLDKQVVLNQQQQQKPQEEQLQTKQARTSSPTTIREMQRALSPNNQAQSAKLMPTMSILANNSLNQTTTLSRQSSPASINTQGTNVILNNPQNVSNNQQLANAQITQQQVTILSQPQQQIQAQEQTTTINKLNSPTPILIRQQPHIQQINQQKPSTNTNIQPTGTVQSSSPTVEALVKSQQINKPLTQTGSPMSQQDQQTITKIVTQPTITVSSALNNNNNTNAASGTSQANSNISVMTTNTSGIQNTNLSTISTASGNTTGFTTLIKPINSVTISLQGQPKQGKSRILIK